MTFLNEADWDRAIRFIAGIMLIGSGWLWVGGTVGLILLALGAVALITGVAGWCPAYTACGISTRKPVSAHHPFR